MYDPVSRREFIRSALAAGIATPSLLSGAPSLLRGDEPAKPSKDKLNLGVIGVAAQGAYNLNNVSSENIVALCDIDAGRLAEGAKKHPQAKTYDDYRRVLEHKELDGLVVATPDHMHAFPAVQALRQGLAVYCEKPLAHSVWEIRQMRNLAREKKAVTQMGTQIHAGENYRRVVELVQAGAIGPVKRVHVWQANFVKPGKRAKEGEVPVPKGVSYDLWIGPAPYRPFHPSHFHFDWRFWWDFGGGTLADIGCHYIDLPYWALKLHAPTTVHCTKSEKGHDGDNDVPTFMQVEYQFPARGDLPPVHLTWYQGGWMPEGAEQYAKKSAILFEGDEGRLLADYSTRKVYLNNGKEAEMVPQTIPNSIGHHKEWIEAVKNKGTTTCNFEYSGELAETVLLGNVSHRVGNKLLEWDSAKLAATNCPEAEQYLKREYRQGWVL
ncbi:MAG: Gfo/Idh/MocA family oxidoreductase [Planctomycetales bacterium]